MTRKGPILNYTTTISAGQSAAEILGVIAKLGAQRSSITYDDAQHPTSLTFTLKLDGGPEVDYRLPAKVDGVHKILTDAWDKGQISGSEATRVQARKVAWRILKTWVEGQVAAIQAGLVEPAEVMLPYALTDSGQTFYEAFSDSRLALPAGGGK